MSVAFVDLSPGGPVSVTDALVNASRATGVDFGYLLKTAQRESSLDPTAKSKTSSATGLFQFVQQTWLRALKEHGADHGYAAEAAVIEKTPSGKLTVADPAQRRAILSLRKDPEASALMAAELTRDSRSQLERSLGRDVDDSELYLAHFLGAGGAARFISACEMAPNESAAANFPDAAMSNPSIFYGSDGMPRTLAEVKSQLGLMHSRGASPPPTTLAQSDDSAPPQTPAVFGRATPASFTTMWTAPTQALHLTPQILAILSSLDPIPDSRGAQRSYSSVLASHMSY